MAKPKEPTFAEEYKHLRARAESIVTRRTAEIKADCPNQPEACIRWSELEGKAGNIFEAAVLIEAGKL